jgi:thioredoxin-related protein
VRRIFVLLVLLFAVVAFSYVGMLDDFDTAMRLASIEKKEAIIMFSDKNCSYCVKFEKETLADRNVQEILRAGFVFAQIYKSNPGKATFPTQGESKEYSYGDLYAAFGVRGTPTFWFYTTDGAPLTQLPGYVPASDFIPIVRFIGEKAYETVKFDDYRKVPSEYVGTAALVKVNGEDYGFVLAKDPLAREYNGEEVDPFTVWLTKDLATGQQLLERGAFRVLVLN